MKEYTSKTQTIQAMQWDGTDSCELIGWLNDHDYVWRIQTRAIEKTQEDIETWGKDADTVLAIFGSGVHQYTFVEPQSWVVLRDGDNLSAWGDKYIRENYNL